jgi:hypothetical protein
MAMTLVSTVTVGSGGAASIEFTSIPSSGKDLLVLFSARTNLGSSADLCGIQINGNTTSGNYVWRELAGYNTTVQSSSYNGYIMAGYANGSTTTSNTFHNASIYFANYASATAKSASTDVVKETNGTANDLGIYASSWNQTSAITSLKIISLNSQNFVQYSTASLYIIS